MPLKYMTSKFPVRIDGSCADVLLTWCQRSMGSVNRKKLSLSTTECVSFSFPNLYPSYADQCEEARLRLELIKLLVPFAVKMIRMMAQIGLMLWFSWVMLSYSFEGLWGLIWSVSLLILSSADCRLSGIVTSF
jgi:hypothetical protein